MSAQHYTFFDARVFADPHLASQDDILLDHDTAGEPGLSSHHYVISDLAVVSDVHQIVDFSAPPDAGDFERSPIDRRVGSNLHIICDFEAPYLRKLLIGSIRRVSDITEAIAAENRSGMNDYSIAESCTRVDGYIG